MLLRVDRLQLLQSGLPTADALQKRGGKVRERSILDAATLPQRSAESLRTGPVVNRLGTFALVL